MHFWLMKSEPEEYCISDLQREGSTVWTGVRNYQARNFMREMKVGDLVLFYHSNAGKETGVTGVGEIAREVYPDPTQFDVKSKYFDEKSKKENLRWSAVDLTFRQRFALPLLLSTMRTMPALASMKLLQKGSRLSVTPVSKKEFEVVLKVSS